MQGAKAYQKAAENHAKAKSESDVAQCFIETSRCYIRAGDSKTATAMLETEALPRMVDQGRLSQAAKLHQEVAEMFEQDGSLAEAMENYQKAADLFQAENAGSTASKCLSKVAHLAAQLDPPDYEKAAETFASVGAECMNSNLMKFSAKGYFLQSVLCTLARGDIVHADSQLERFKEQDYTFECACTKHQATVFPREFLTTHRRLPPFRFLQRVARGNSLPTSALQSRTLISTPFLMLSTIMTRSRNSTLGRRQCFSRSRAAFLAVVMAVTGTSCKNKQRKK